MIAYTILLVFLGALIGISLVCNYLTSEDGE